MAIRVNQKSISVKVKELIDGLHGDAKGKLREMSDYLVRGSPVDSGAYVESFSVRYSSDSGGRRRSSKGRPRDQDIDTYHNIALSNMNSDIDTLDFESNSSTSVSIRNRAPHAGDENTPNTVEYNYQVFARARDKYRNG